MRAGQREFHGEAKESLARSEDSIPEPDFAEGQIAERNVTRTELGLGRISITLAAQDGHLRRKVAPECLPPAPGDIDDAARPPSRCCACTASASRGAARRRAAESTSLLRRS